MQHYRTPVALFLLAAGLPFVVSVAFFMISQRRSLLTGPEAYTEFLKQTGSASHMISLNAWKHFLACDPLCREATEPKAIASANLNAPRQERQHAVSGGLHDGATAATDDRASPGPSRPPTPHTGPPARSA